MESTGKYWIPVFNILEEAKIYVLLTHPRILNQEKVREYQILAATKSMIDRSASREKSGIQLDGISAINPINGNVLPVFVADYVLMYGTGAVMGVPGHDDRDWEFAIKWNIPIIEVVSGGDISTGAFVEDGELVNSGNSPLAKLSDWVICVCPKCGKPAKRETDTMPNWAGSSWYWLRFIDPDNTQSLAGQNELDYWGAVDLYTGGTEHVTRHMLYASFWHNFLYDIGVVQHKLPFTRRMCNGLILDNDGKKMSKSSENAIDPLEVIERYGADVFRLHMMFIGDYEQNTVWTLQGDK